MSPEGIERLLKGVQAGRVTVEDAVQRLRTLPFEDLGFASLDHHRSLRQGFPEVLLCEGKTAKQSVAIARSLIKKGGPFLATRAEPVIAKAILKEINFHGPLEIQAEYPNGGAENAQDKLTLPRIQVLAAMKRDLLTLRRGFAASGLL